MAKKQVLKKPNDYPLFGYRVLPTIKEALVDQLEEVLNLLNKRAPDDQKPKKKNDVFVEALKLGFGALREGTER